MSLPSVYGVMYGKDGVHVDISTSLHATKIYATKIGVNTISVRHNGSYIAKEVYWKRNGKWTPLENGQTRNKSKTFSK